MALNHRLHRAEEALREREIAFAALAKVAPVGIMRFDAHGRCNYVNDRWTAITGLTIDGAIGTGWQRAVHPEDRAVVCERWRQMRDADDLFREEYRVCRADGSVRWVLAEGAALRAYSGEPLGFIRAVTDITRHRELEGDLSAAREELEERVRERTVDLETEMVERQRLEKEVLQIKENEQRRFSRDLHDGLGQSLTGILFHALALERDLRSEQLPFASMASKIAELVDQAINQAHDLARGIDPVPLRPDGLVCALRELVQARCHAQPIQCLFHCDEPVLVADSDVATHLYRIAQEAMTNALKHSRASQLAVRFEQRGASVILTISDDGIGLSRPQNATGGRGLNIMKHRARLIGAALSIETRPGSGTTVQCVFESNENAAHEEKDQRQSQNSAGG